MAKRRQASEGALFKRTIHGRMRWVAEVTTGFDAQGRRQRRTVYAATMAEAQTKLEELRGKIVLTWMFSRGASVSGHTSTYG